MTGISQLSAQDSQFLYVQGGDVLTHVMSINLYDPSTAPGGAVRFKDIVQHVSSRCHTSPVFMRKLHRLPLDLDHPYWIADPDFDVEAHISHVRLPKPGDWRQFCILAARHFARPMDMGRPLWDMCVVEGLDRIPGVVPGSYALLQRFHHSAIDGASGAYALIALSDKDARGTPVVPARAAPVELGVVPTPATMVTRALTSNLASPVRMLNALMKLSPVLVAAAKKRLAEPAGQGAGRCTGHALQSARVAAPDLRCGVRFAVGTGQPAPTGRRRDDQRRRARRLQRCLAPVPAASMTTCRDRPWWRWRRSTRVDAVARTRCPATTSRR